MLSRTQAVIGSWLPHKLMVRLRPADGNAMLVMRKHLEDPFTGMCFSRYFFAEVLPTHTLIEKR